MVWSHFYFIAIHFGVYFIRNFYNFFTDYIEQGLIVRGNNHARNLEDQFYGLP